MHDMLTYLKKGKEKGKSSKSEPSDYEIAIVLVVILINWPVLIRNVTLPIFFIIRKSFKILKIKTVSNNKTIKNKV